jgi:hypothetical protein
MPRRSKGCNSTAVAELQAPQPPRQGSTTPAIRPSVSAANIPAGHRWRQRLREFRFLAVILGAGVLLAFYESSRDDLPKTIAQVPAEWLMNDRVNMARTLTELYPERSYGHFLRSYQAAMCWDQGFAPPVCDAFPYKDLRDVRRALDDAIARGGAAEQEELFHFYAFMLARSNEPPEVIDEAVRQWRRHYPHSKKPDPRQVAAASN